MADSYHDRFDGILDDDTIDELIDLRLRREFGRAFPPAGGDPVGELRALGPAMRRARGVHRARRGALGLAAALLLVAGVGATVDRLPPLDGQSVAADGSGDAGPDDGDLPEVDGATLEVTGTTVVDEPEGPPADEQARTPETVPSGSTATETASAPAPAVVEADGGAATGDPGTTASSGPAPASTTSTTQGTAGRGTDGTSPPPPTQPAATPTSSGTTSTAKPTTTRAKPTTTRAKPTTTTTKPTTSTTSAPSTTVSGDSLVASSCGSITVSVTGIYVFLENVSAGPGYRADTRSNGPYKVEVGLAGSEHREERDESASECQITAQVVSGRLRTEIEQ